MSLEVLLVSGDIQNAERTRNADHDLAKVLGASEDAIAAKISDVLKAISDGVADSVAAESELTIEITGSMKLKGEGGVKWLVFNVGAGTEKSNELKVVLKTKLSPAGHKNRPSL